MMRTVSLLVVFALTAPAATAVLCELVVCREAHHDVREPDDCHSHDDASAGASWSGTGAACHDASDGLADAIVEATAPLVAALPIAWRQPGSAGPDVPIAHVLARPRAGPAAAILGATPLRI